jgi:hypothetical protein
MFFVPFLHFQTYFFCIDILFYDFHMDYIEISWYSKFVMNNHMLMINIIYMF